MNQNIQILLGKYIPTKQKTNIFLIVFLTFRSLTTLVNYFNFFASVIVPSCLIIFGYRWTNEMKKFPKYKESHAILGKFSQKMFKKNWIKAGRSKL